MSTPDEEYWNWTSNAELRFQNCAACGAWQFPPAARCRECLSNQLEWKPVSGRGTVWSWIRVHKKYFPQPEFQSPYQVAMVQLEEGVRMISTVAAATGTTSLNSYNPRVDEPVELYFDDELDSNGHRLPRFRSLAGTSER